MFKKEQGYLISTDGYAPIHTVRPGHRDVMVNTAINGRIVDLEERDSRVTRVCVDVAAIARAQSLVGAQFPSTNLDIEAWESVENIGMPICGLNGMSIQSDVYIVVGAPNGARVAFHPFSVLVCSLRTLGQPGAFKAELIAAINNSGNVKAQDVLDPNEAL